MLNGQLSLIVEPPLLLTYLGEKFLMNRPCVEDETMRSACRFPLENMFLRVFPLFVEESSSIFPIRHCIFALYLKLKIT